MDNIHLRKEMASHAIEDSKRYTPSVVCEKRHKLLVELMMYGAK